MGMILDRGSYPAPPRTAVMRSEILQLEGTKPIALPDLLQNTDRTIP